MKGTLAEQGKSLERRSLCGPGSTSGSAQSSSGGCNS